MKNFRLFEELKGISSRKWQIFSIKGILEPILFHFFQNMHHPIRNEKLGKVPKLKY